jgi:hypothetical protein
MGVMALINADTRRDGRTSTSGRSMGPIWFRGFMGETRGVWQDRWLEFRKPVRHFMTSEAETTAPATTEPREQLAQEVPPVAAPASF